MSEEMQSVDQVGDGLCEACRNGNVQTPNGWGVEIAPGVFYRPFTDEDRARADADVERWEREGLLVHADEEAGR